MYQFIFGVEVEVAGSRLRPDLVGRLKADTVSKTEEESWLLELEGPLTSMSQMPALKVMIGVVDIVAACQREPGIMTSAKRSFESFGRWLMQRHRCEVFHVFHQDEIRQFGLCLAGAGLRGWSKCAAPARLVIIRHHGHNQA